MSPQMQKRAISILSTAISAGLSNMLSQRLINVPEEPGIADDVKEALLRAGFTVAGTFIASAVVRVAIRRT